MNNFYQQQEQILWNQISNNKIFKDYMKAKTKYENGLRLKQALAKRIAKEKTFISNKAKELKQYFANQQDYIGLDKVNVSNLIITTIDTELLLHHPNAKVYTEDKSLAKAITTKPTTQNSTFTYSTILVEDNIKFKSLTLGATITQSGVKDYSQLICFVDRNDEQANYKPYTVAEFKQYITSLQPYIKETYGITIDFSEATFKEIEMNQNVLLQRDFHSYQHTITYLAQNASKKYSRLSKKYTSTKDLIAKLYKEETQEKLISLFSINQLHNTSHYTQALTLLSQAQLTAQDDLDYMTSILKVA